MDHYFRRQRRVHRRFNRRARTAGEFRLSFWDRYILPQASLRPNQLNRDEKIVCFRSNQPLARCFDPQNVIDFDGRVAGTRLNQKRIGADSC
jgi:hypothetical protein